jgi:UDP-galactopyranose mutase
MYNFLIVGSGLYGITISRLLRNAGYTCLIIERRDKLGGNIVDEKINDIIVHTYGPHIFHTDSDEVWEFVNKYSNWNQFTLQIMAKSKNKLYNLPFNMNTFYKLFETHDIDKINEIIESEIKTYGVDEPKNLKEQAINLVGKTVYETLIKEYTEKQWGKPCEELEPFIIKRLPIRYTFDNNYFNDKYEAIPSEGYSKFIENVVNGVNNEKNIPYILNTDFKTFMKNTKLKFGKIIYTGAIDELFDYELGELQWRSLNFVVDNKQNVSNFQGCVTLNYIDKQYPWTRIIEHKHFYPHNTNNTNNTIITYEYPCNWDKTKEKYYPINNKKTEDLYNKYILLSKLKYKNMYFGGRLGKYKYFDMDDVILNAMNDFKNIYNV